MVDLTSYVFRIVLLISVLDLVLLIFVLCLGARVGVYLVIACVSYVLNS